MRIVHLDPGVAPAVAWSPSGGWDVAVGETTTVTGAPCVSVYTLDQNGEILGRLDLADGFGYPVLCGDWCGYKGNASIGFAAKLISLITNEAHVFEPATGNSPVALNARMFAWQTTTSYNLNVAPLLSLGSKSVIGTGAADGIAWLEDNGAVALVKDVRFSIAGMDNPQRCGPAPYTYVGEHPSALAMVVQLPDGSQHALLPGEDSQTPKIACSPDGQSYAIVTWGAPGVRVVLASRAELAALPAPGASIPPAPPSQPAPAPQPAPVPAPPKEPAPVSFDAQRTETWTDDYLKSQIRLYLDYFANDSNPGKYDYWFIVIRSKPSGGTADWWAYWVPFMRDRQPGGPAYTGPVPGGGPSPAPTPTPSPIPAPVPVPDAGLTARVAALEGQIAVLHTLYDQLAGTINDHEGELDARLKALEQPQPTTHRTIAVDLPVIAHGLSLRAKGDITI